MLARAHRLTRGQDFSETVRRGRRSATSTVVLHLLDVDGSDVEPRVGMVVSKQVGNAVTRNQVKRRLRHLLRDRVDQLARGAMLVVRVSPAAGSATSRLLGRDLDRALGRLTGARG